MQMCHCGMKTAAAISFEAFAWVLNEIPTSRKLSE